jgi:hypothetical protein
MVLTDPPCLFTDHCWSDDFPELVVFGVLPSLLAAAEDAVKVALPICFCFLRSVLDGLLVGRHERAEGLTGIAESYFGDDIGKPVAISFCSAAGASAVLAGKIVELELLEGGYIGAV